MLTLQLTGSFKVTQEDRRLIVIRQQNGDLLVTEENKPWRTIEAKHAEWFEGLCKSCLTFEELEDYEGRKNG